MVIVSAGIVVISKAVVRSSRVVPAAVVESVGSAVVLSVPWVDESPTVVEDICPSVTAEVSSFVVAGSLVIVEGCEGLVSGEVLVEVSVTLEDIAVVVSIVSLVDSGVMVTAVVENVASTVALVKPAEVAVDSSADVFASEVVVDASLDVEVPAVLVRDSLVTSEGTVV
jgi:hypothetical protein